MLVKYYRVEYFAPRYRYTTFMSPSSFPVIYIFPTKWRPADETLATRERKHPSISRCYMTHDLQHGKCSSPNIAIHKAAPYRQIADGTGTVHVSPHLSCQPASKAASPDYRAVRVTRQDAAYSTYSYLPACTARPSWIIPVLCLIPKPFPSRLRAC